MITALHNQSVTDIRNNYLAQLKSAEERKGQVMVHHFGDFSTDLINGLAEAVEELMISNGDSKKSVKRVFSILVEGLQNIRRHGEKDEDNCQNAYFIFVRYKSEYEIVMGNMIGDEDLPIAKSYLDRINQLDHVALKDLYVNILDNSFFTRKGGVGLGFLTMRLKSEKPLIYQFVQLQNKRCFFTVQVMINRNM
jgi:hypothetical protein